jgi:cation diffusion facilitator CzcD-associated flavoprotein CzcO
MSSDVDALADRAPVNAGAEPPGAECDVVVVGAGFSGLYLHHLLRQSGLTVIGFDDADDVGGTWTWNRYPGARCDIESWDYSYSFSPELDQEWTWSERYAAQPEILRYLRHVADRFDLRRDIRFRTRVLQVRWDEPARCWTLTTDRGETVRTRFCVMAVGCLSTPKGPDIEGIDRFAGDLLYTARWPHEPPDLRGKRVGVVGTGSSGVQCIPIIAEQAAELTVFMRTPSFALPAHNRQLDEPETLALKESFPEHRRLIRQSNGGVLGTIPEVSALHVSPEEREQKYQAGWDSGALFGLAGAFNDIMINPQANETVADFVRQQIRDIVEDPVMAEALCPVTYPFGARRSCLDTGFYATFNRPDVTLVNLRQEPIVEVTIHGVSTSENAYPLDTLVLATGFDAVTGPLLAMDIRGCDDLPLGQAWAEGPITYLGVAIAGFPNLFTVTGPGSPSVLTNMVASIEQHVEWIVDCINHVCRQPESRIEATPEAQEKWTEHVAEVAAFTVYPQADSWYMGANIAGKPRRFLPYIAGLNVFRGVCNDVAENAYRGFVVT